MTSLHSPPNSNPPILIRGESLGDLSLMASDKFSSTGAEEEEGWVLKLYEENVCTYSFLLTGYNSSPGLWLRRRLDTIP